MIIGMIPARAGSRGVRKKNIWPLAGYPLIAYSIAASKLSTKIDRTIVSTDSQEYADVALSYGAEVPFLRPPEISTDISTDLEFVLHLLEWFDKAEDCCPKLLVHLRPTVPLRDPNLIDQAIETIMQREDATSLRSAHEAVENPFKALRIVDGFFEGLFPFDPRKEYFNLPRQSFPPSYCPDGYVDVVKSQVVMNTGTIHGTRMLPFIVPNVGGLDTLEDFDAVEWKLQKHGSVLYEYLRQIAL